MADPIAVGWVLSATFRGELFNQLVMTTFNYEVTEVPGGGAPSNILAITQFNTAFLAPGDMIDDYTNAMPVEYNLVAMDYQWIAPLRYRKVSKFDAAGPGNGGTTTTPNLAACITLAGDRATRRTVSTKHLPGLGGADIDDGILNGGAIARYGVVATQAQAAVVAAGTTYKPIIYGRFIAPFTKCGKDYPGQPELTTLIEFGFPQVTARVMRRRTVGVGV